MLSAALRADLWRSALLYDHFSAVITVVSRDPVAPPELAADTPVSDIREPVLICLYIIIRYELQVTLSACLKSCFAHLFHADEPLRLYHRLDSCVTPVMCSDCVSMRNYFYQETLLIEVFYHSLSGFVTVHSGVLSALVVHRTVVIQNADFLKVMAFSYFEVIRVVCRCDLHTASSKLLVHI